MNRIRNLPSQLIVLLLLAGLSIGCDRTTSRIGAIIPLDAGFGSAEPNLATGPDGTVVLSWLVQIGNETALRYSVFTDDQWTAAKTVAQGRDWFVNWADFPSVVPVSRNLWAAHWLVRSSSGAYSYDISIATSQDRGDTWSSPVTPHTDGTRTEHGFVSLFPWKDGVGAVWLDGRNMAPGAHDTQSDSASGMTLRSAVITATGELTSEHLVDELVCDCCQTDAALTDGGPVVAYRNRTASEIRDVYLARYQNDIWQSGQSVAADGWEINGCPVNGPAIAAEGNRVGVAWFTAAQGHSRVRLARSDDGGSTFSPALDIDKQRALGRVDTTMLNDGTMAISWLRQVTENDGEIVVRLVYEDGTLGPIHVIANTSTSRPTGFPQMVRHGQQLLFAWTHIGDNEHSVRTASVSLAALR